MTRLICHISDVIPTFAHLEPDRMVIAYNRSRTAGVHGVYASCQPLRFKGGERTIKHHGRTYEMPTIVDDGVEKLYIIYFMLPRFMDLDFETKLTTVFHEIYHVSPEFDGDIRRFKGKNYAHGHSREKYNERMRVLMAKYLAEPGAQELTAFLRPSFDELANQHGGIVGTRVRPPRPRPAK